MKLNPEIIRGILLTIEDKCDFDTVWEYRKVHYYDGGANVLVCDLTPAGHEFLANTRNESVWKKTLARASEASLPILLEVAKDAALNHFLKK